MSGKAEPPKAGEKLTEINEIINQIASLSDRELVVVSCSILEDALKDLLLSKIVDGTTPKEQKELMSGYGPIASFSTRIALAAAFGFIPERMKADLNTIRSVRNRFAHSYSVMSFKDGSISAICSNLRTVDEATAQEFASEVTIGNDVSSTDHMGYLWGKQVDYSIQDSRRAVAAYLYPLDMETNSPRVRFINAAKLNWFFCFYMSIKRLVS